MVFSLLVLLCSPQYKTVYNPLLKTCDRHLQSHSNEKAVTCFSETANGGRKLLAVGCNWFISRRREKKKQGKQHKLAQLIKVIHTLANLSIVIPELIKFRTIECLGHLHIFSIPCAI